MDLIKIWLWIPIIGIVGITLSFFNLGDIVIYILLLLGIIALIHGYIVTIKYIEEIKSLGG